MKKSLTDMVAEFNTHYGKGLAEIAKAAKIYADAILAYNSDAVAAFHDAHPTWSDVVWDKMRAIGTGAMDPYILLCSDRMTLRIARLPIEKQRALLKDGERSMVSVVDPQKMTVTKKPVADVTKREEEVLFDEHNNIRTPKQQMAYIGKMVETPKKTIPLYTIEGNILFIHRQGKITKGELVKILEAMK